MANGPRGGETVVESNQLRRFFFVVVVVVVGVVVVVVGGGGLSVSLGMSETQRETGEPHTIRSVQCSESVCSGPLWRLIFNRCVCLFHSN